MDKAWEPMERDCRGSRQGRARVVLVGRETNADELGNERRSEEKGHWENRRYTAARMQEWSCRRGWETLVVRALLLLKLL